MLALANVISRGNNLRHVVIVQQSFYLTPKEEVIFYSLENIIQTITLINDETDHHIEGLNLTK